MHVISSIIQTLSDESKRNFIAILRQKNKRNDTKNIQLFKLLDTTTTVKDLDIQIYGKRAKGAYHALCKRLHDTLIDFIAAKSFEEETSEEMETLKLLRVSRTFFEQKQYKIAFKTIAKAEQKAKTYALFSILNEIYYTQIQYAHLNRGIAIEALFANFRNNKKSLQQEENLNLFYATVQHELMKQRRDAVPIIKNTLSKFGLSITQDLTFRSLFKILEITNQTAYITRDYYAILPFVEEVYTQIDTKENVIEKHLFYHIQILYYVANSYFRNKDFTTSQQYLTLMHKQMKKHQNKYYKRFFPQYILLHSLNLNYTGQAKDAIMTLNTFDYEKYKDQIAYILDLKLSHIVYYFQQQQYKEALGILNDFYHSDHWYTEKAGLAWVIKKNLVEILLHIELDHIDIVESRVNSFKKKHGVYLKNNKEIRVSEFLKLAITYYHKPEVVTTAAYRDKVYTTLTTPTPKDEDIFDMSFYAWIKTKAEGTTLYETTLQLVHQ
jgi:tetratricopeptide (TPR) repeat protein